MMSSTPPVLRAAHWFLLGSAISLAAVLSSAAAEKPTQLPTLEELFRPQSIDQAQLSPNGEYLAALYANEHDTHNLTVFTLGSKQAVTLSGAEHFDPIAVRWLSNDQLIMNVDRDTPGVTSLFVANRGRNAAGTDFATNYYPLEVGDALATVGVPRARSDRALVWLGKSAQGVGTSAGLAEVKTGFAGVVVSGISGPGGGGRTSAGVEGNRIAQLVPVPKSGVPVRWMANGEGELALGFIYEGGQPHLQRYRASDQSWQPVLLKLDEYTVLHMDPDGHSVWVVHHDAAAGSSLQRYDLDSAKFDNPVYSDSDFDLATAQLFFSRKEKKLAGLSYYQHRLRNVWLLPVFAGVQHAVDQNNPEWDNRLVDVDEQERRFVFRSNSPRQPDIFQLVDLVKKSDDHIISAAPWLKDRSFADAQIVRIRSRDGVPLEALVTLPLGATKENPPPLVVLVHGGPWVRDLWAFNPVVQLLASRGYAVLQPGYRGSAGFSAAVSEAGRFEFRHMVDDIADATHGVQKSGLVDPTRTAVMGTGFGGTLALAAAEAEPDLYRCVISGAGVFDWEELIRDLRTDGHPGEYESSRDNPGANQAAFNEIAPLVHLANLHVPVFFAHGTDDASASGIQAKALVAALEKQGTPHETFFRGLKAGNFYGNADRIEFYRQVDAFLGKNLGGGATTPTGR